MNLIGSIGDKIVRFWRESGEPARLRGWPAILAEETLSLHYKELADHEPQALAELKRIMRDPDLPPFISTSDEEKVWRKELDIIHGILHRLRRDVRSARPHLAADYGHSALCLSGGGIRSAAFALGVLQGLARQGCLDKFKYLSTVSGGGYIGGWLSAWISRRRGSDGVTQVANELGTPGAEPGPLQKLRGSTNFLSPQVGLLSADSWTPVMLFLRNLLLNWFILVPAAFAAMVVPQLLYEVFSRPDWSIGWGVWIFLALGLGLTLFSTIMQLRTRPSWAFMKYDQPQVIARIILPFIAASFCFGIVALASPDPMQQPWPYTAIPVVFAVGWLTAWRMRERFHRLNPAAALAARVLETNRLPRWKKSWDFVCWVLCGAGYAFGVAAIGPLSHWEAIRIVPSVDPGVLDWWRSLSFTLPAILGVRVLGEILFNGLISSDRSIEDDREWSGRLIACLAIAGLAWAFLMTVSLAGGDLLIWLARRLTGATESESVNGATAALGGVAGAVAAILSWSSKTLGIIREGETKLREKLSFDRLLVIAAGLFIIILAIMLSVSVTWLVNVGVGIAENQPYPIILHALRGARDILVFLGNPRLALCLALLVAAIVVALAASLAINVNRFNQQGIYRNRLIRGFLGPSREMRNPDPFTGFDEHDNLPMSRLWGRRRQARLFHIVNTTLNMAATENPAWIERKADAFAMTPLRVGNPRLGFRPARSYGGLQGITLGMAMAISGAAVSPNQGYHSSPLMALLMTLFNVRLGAWLGNPRKEGVWRQAGPRLAALPLLGEAFLRTDETSDILYLSDGGHFENLGLYEAVRRRCSLILVSDAGCDPTMQYADLGNAIRKISIDLGVQIKFDGGPAMPPRQTENGVKDAPRSGGKYWAVADILYPEIGAKPGKLIYIKPTYYGDEPPDVRAYALANQQFPHDTTLNQWFSESQFESYRRLGAYCVETMAASGGTVADLLGAMI